MNNLTTSLILAIAIAVVFIVISAVAYKLHLKNKNTRILKKIHNNEYSLDELKEYYYQSLSRIKKTGAKAYLAMPIVYVLSDSSNYFVSLNSIYRENVAMLLILTLTLSIILDHTPTAISEYIFSKEKESTIPNKSQKYIGIAIGLLVAVMFSFIVMLFLIRVNTTDLVFEGSSADKTAQTSMMILWTEVAIGTTISSFIYKAIRDLILVPRLLKALNCETEVLANAQLSNVEAQITELEKYANQEVSESDKVHESNIQKILSDGALLEAMYLARIQNISSNKNARSSNKSVSLPSDVNASQKEHSIS